MKRRVHSDDWTDEDTAIWATMDLRSPLQFGDTYYIGDRQDANLMYECQATWRAGFVSRPDYMYLGPLSIARPTGVVYCGGDIVWCTFRWFRIPGS